MADDRVIPRSRRISVGGVLIGLGVLALAAVVAFIAGQRHATRRCAPMP